MTGELTLQAAGAADEAFLLRVYATTRAAEMELAGWDAAAAAAFVRMQFDVQRRSYALQYPDADWQVVLHQGRPVGRLMVRRAADEIRLIDVALLPERRGAGIGTALVAALQTEAAASGRPLRLQAETGSRAMRLYGRLGFAETGTAGFHTAMEWAPAAGRPQLSVGAGAARG